MDYEELISRVQLNRPIWDKRLKEHSNRNVVDACWRHISTELMTDEAVLRKKWKYLRDQFSVEWSKIKPPKSGDPAGSSEPKWAYFRKLLFLKDIVKPRASSSNLNRKSSRDDKQKPEDFSLNAVEIETHDLNEVVVGTNDLNEVVVETNDLNEVVVETNDLNEVEIETQDEPVSRKRKRSTYYNEILQIEQKKINTIQSIFNKDPENSDLTFFKSLLPFVTKIPDNKKLAFRNRIQEIVEEFVYKDGNLQSSSLDHDY